MLSLVPMSSGLPTTEARQPRLCKAQCLRLEDFRLCVEYLLDSLQKAQPELWELLDVGLAEMTRIDCTYSIKCANPDILRQTIKQMGNVSNRYINPPVTQTLKPRSTSTVLPRRIRSRALIRTVYLHQA